MDSTAITQGGIIKRLRSENIVDVITATFSKSAKAGHIPYTKNNTGKKVYVYEDVRHAIVSMGLFGCTIDPTKYSRDADTNIDTEGLSPIEILRKRILINPTLQDVNTLKNLILSEREQIKLDSESGVLISRDEVEDKAFKATRVIRDKILTIPERLSNELATMNDPHAIKEVLYAEFAVLLNGFSKEVFL